MPPASPYFCRAIIAPVAAVTLCLASPAWATFEEGLHANQRKDYVAAMKSWRPLAEQGDPRAQAGLGMLYHFGLGVAQDDQEAARWHRRAAEQGFALGQYALGELYEAGLGVKQDYQEAVLWYRLAAEQGNDLAQSKLGLMYELGRGVSRDYVQAHRWYSLAGAKGHELSLALRDELGKKMTPSQIAEAQRLAREWKPKRK